MSRKLLCLTVAIIVLAAVGTTQAGLIAYDGFNDYTAGSNLFGQSGGTGWSGAWASSGDTGPTWTAYATGLGYTDTEGKTLATQLGSGEANNPLLSPPATKWLVFNRAFSGQSSGTLYFSQLINFYYNEGGKGPDYVSVQNSERKSAVMFSPAWGNSTQRLIVRDTTTAETSVALTGNSPSAGTTYFVVGRIDFNANGTSEVVKLYINPTLSAEPGTYTATVNNRDLGTISLWEGFFRGGNLTNTVYIDEIRVGTTWADVAPVVPEPSTIVLLASGLVGLLAYAWRKRK
jgi:hypothetical protein